MYRSACTPTFTTVLQVYFLFYHTFICLLFLLPHLLNYNFYFCNFFYTLTRVYFYFITSSQVDFFFYHIFCLLLLYHTFVSILLLLPHFRNYTSSLPHFHFFYLNYTSTLLLLPQLHKYAYSFTTITQVHFFVYHNYTSTLLLLPHLHSTLFSYVKCVMFVQFMRILKDNKSRRGKSTRVQMKFMMFVNQN